MTKATSVSLGQSIKHIGVHAFSKCRCLKSITIPDNVTDIEEGAFEDCVNLTSITIPDNVTDIGDNAFYSCRSLTSITIPDSVNYIGDNAFDYEKLVIRFRGTKVQWDTAVGNRYLVYKSIIYNCFSQSFGHLVYLQ